MCRHPNYIIWAGFWCISGKTGDLALGVRTYMYMYMHVQHIPWHLASFIPFRAQEWVVSSSGEFYSWSLYLSSVHAYLLVESELEGGPSLAEDYHLDGAFDQDSEDDENQDSCGVIQSSKKKRRTALASIENWSLFACSELCRLILR